MSPRVRDSAVDLDSMPTLERLQAIGLAELRRRAAISAGKKGRRFTELHKARISEGLRVYHARRKAAMTQVPEAAPDVAETEQLRLPLDAA